MNQKKNKLLDYWLSLIKKRKQVEKEKKEKEKLGILFYFKKIALVSGAFTLGLVISPKKKDEATTKLSLEESLTNIKKIKDNIQKENTIDKVHDGKLSLEMEEVELKDKRKKIETKESQNIYDLCEQELKETKEIISDKIEKFESRLEENMVKIRHDKNVNQEKKEIYLQEENTKENIIENSFKVIGKEQISKEKQKIEENIPLIKVDVSKEEIVVPSKGSDKEEIKDFQKDSKTKLEENKEIERLFPEEKGKEKMPEKQTISKEEMLDYVMMSKMIDENIKKNKEKVESLKKEMQAIEPMLQKQKFLGKLKILANGFTKSMLSLLPIKLFKNKTIGILTSSVLINNSIRSMRNTMRREEYYLEYLNYERVNNKITSTISDMDKIYYICEDSLEQISNFRRELLSKYEMNEDLDIILNEISSIEINVMKKMNSLENAKQNISKTGEEVKQKILKKEE